MMEVAKFIENTVPAPRPQNHSMVAYYCCNQSSVSASHSQISSAEYHNTKTSVPMHCCHEQYPLSVEYGDLLRSG